MSTDEWISALESGWRQRDPSAIAGLFSDDAYYHRGPFGEPHRGRDAIRAHWVETLSRQVDPRIWFGSAIESAGRAAVEFWCVLHDPATREPRTASGCLTLRFGSDGRCSVLHEYWHAELTVAIDPAEDWFSPRAEGPSVWVGDQRAAVRRRLLWRFFRIAARRCHARSIRRRSSEVAWAAC